MLAIDMDAVLYCYKAMIGHLKQLLTMDEQLLQAHLLLY